MTILSEEQAQKLKTAGLQVPYVNETCIGCSACVAISGEVFELNDEGKSEVIALDSYEGKDVDDSISACPVDAISWRV
jgi:ferredoxin